MKVWISSNCKPYDAEFAYCDSLLSAYELYYNLKKENRVKEIAYVKCDKEYFDALSKFFACTFILAPMPKIEII